MNKYLLPSVTGRYIKLLVFAFLICISLNAQGRSYNKMSVNLSGDNISLKEVFNILSNRTGLHFTYSNELIDDNRIISVRLSNLKLDTILTKILEGTNYSWNIKDKAVIITLRPNSNSAGDRTIDTLLKVSGLIIDENGKPIPGASISIKNATRGAVSNENGEFVLSGVAPLSKLIISSVGFISLEFFVEKKWQWRTFVMKENINTLDETVISTYLPTSKRYSLGGLSTISAKQIENKPITNPLLALQGEVPGIVVNQNSGIANAGITVQIRGQNSFQNGTDPLYIIDGVPYPSQLLQLLNSATGRSGSVYNATASTGNPLNFINPNDIESISVLKDADATSIYGSRAAAGAILITTKRGKPGLMNMNINFQKGIGNVSRFLDVLNTKQYLSLRHLAKSNDGAEILPSDYDLNGTWDTTKSVNWQKELFGKTANFTQIQSSFSGGTDNIQYLIGLGYHKETTVYPTNFWDQKGSIHFNINNVSNDKKFQVQFTGNYMLDINRLPVNNIVQNAIYLPPVAPQLYNSDGTLNWATNADSVSTWRNPLATFNSKARIKTANLVSNLNIQYEIISGLKFKLNFGYTNMQIDEFQTFPLTINAPELRKSSIRRASYGTGNSSSWIMEPQLSYISNVGKGRVEALVGATLQERNDGKLNLSGSKYSSDLLLEDPRSASTLTTTSNVSAKYKYSAIFGIVNYRFKDRYLINLSIRRDGSSRFGPENLFHNFGSVGGGWIFSSESWMQKAIPFLSFGKLAASFGTSGNDQIGDYQFMNIFSSNSVPVAYQGVVGLSTFGIPNPYLQWEETRKLQVGLNIGFLDDNLLFLVNYYRNRSSNQLLSYKLPSITGASGYTRNLPATIQNNGWEFSLNTNNIKRTSFTWTSTFNLTISRNKLLSFPGLASSSYASAYELGKPITGVKLYKYHGVDPQTGLYDFYDSQGKLTSDPGANDRTVTLDFTPTFYGGFGNSFSYRGFQMSLLFQVSKQIVSNIAAGLYPGYFSGNVGNQPAIVLNGYWRYPGDVASIQRFSTNPLGTAFTIGSSTFGFTNTWYVRLKNASLSWKLPSNWVQKAKFKDISLSVTGQNLFTITNYNNGMDPESGSIAMPPIRVIMGGININL